MIGFVGRGALVLSLIGLTACTPPQPRFRTLEAALLGKDGRQGERFTLSASYYPGDGAVQLSGILPGGEKFTGNLIQESRTVYTRPPVYRPPVLWRGRVYYPDDDYYDYGPRTEYSSRGQAMLLGSQARTLNCQFTFADAGSGVFGGGFGECSLSDGQKVTLTF
ncbi:hypothetical protein [Elstera cyanobacteriorum]|uniref:hypothetical protein n=1 Tax=Elstera cyanobacteriorum TaxID=2022747 RepID=UPI0023524BF9|nr:hypothetical protein [Elstera cyanobacteriorum]MCK6441439.1 hypothetical protein [Elstera cyanobacteriorum]